VWPRCSPLTCQSTNPLRRADDDEAEPDHAEEPQAAAAAHLEHLGNFPTAFDPSSLRMRVPTLPAKDRPTEVRADVSKLRVSSTLDSFGRFLSQRQGSCCIPGSDRSRQTRR
jgi:hypothetical protein